METRTQAKWIDEGFGFPVLLTEVPMAKVRGRWTPAINYVALGKAVLLQLAQLEGRLTGNHIRFIRLERELTLKQFAERFGVTHPAVLKWERAASKPTGMSWSTEKDIRLSILKSLSVKPKQFVSLYELLERASEKAARRVVVDAEDIAG